MQPYSKDPINYLRNKFDKWYYGHALSGRRQKRKVLIMALLVCIIILMLLPSFSSEMEQKKSFIFAIAAIALINICVLIYENFRDPEGTVPPPLSIFSLMS